MKLAVLLTLLLAGAAWAAPIQFVESSVMHEGDQWRFTLTTDRPLNLPSDRVYFVTADPHLLYVNSDAWHDGLAPVNTISDIVCNSMLGCTGGVKNFEVSYTLSGNVWEAVMPADLVPFDGDSSWPYIWRGRTDGQLAFEVHGVVNAPLRAVPEPSGWVLLAIGLLLLMMRIVLGKGAKRAYLHDDDRRYLVVGLDSHAPSWSGRRTGQRQRRRRRGILLADDGHDEHVVE